MPFAPPAPRRSAAMLSSLALAVLLACGGPGADSPTDTATAAAATTDSLAATSDAPECPETGAWQQCSLEKRLERAGFVAVRGDSAVRHPFLDVPGIAYQLGTEELQVFLYPSAEARSADFADVDPLTVSPPGPPIAWPATPTLITSNNLAAILIGGSSRRVERVQDALTAGLPQP